MQACDILSCALTLKLNRDSTAADKINWRDCDVYNNTCV